MRIGVLALQGAFIEHINRFDELGIEAFEIRQKRDISADFDGLVLPGGESTVMVKLLRELELLEPLRDKIRAGLPVLGTCAGLLLLARKIDNRGVVCFESMDISARRNAYGRQLGSFYAEDDFTGLGTIPMTFIRAPYIESVGEGVTVLARTGGHIVAARQDNQLAVAFHPELGSDTSVHRSFLEMCRSS